MSELTIDEDNYLHYVNGMWFTSLKPLNQHQIEMFNAGLLDIDNIDFDEGC